jgi:hypothetical protein
MGTETIDENSPMNDAAPSLESLLRRALAPVEPPDDLTGRLEETLTNLTELAAGELEGWELSAMRDPRNWARPAAALVVGGAAGLALVVLRARRRGHPESLREAPSHQRPDTR